jgi:hypothetical protein
MKTRNRPAGVTLLALGVLSIAGIHLIRVVETIRSWKFLAELLPVTPVYLALSGLVWFIAWLPLFWGLWRGRTWARPLTLLAAWVFGLYYWLDRLLLRSQAGSTNLPFALGASVFLLLMVHWILSRRSARLFFERKGSVRPV